MGHPIGLSSKYSRSRIRLTSSGPSSSSTLSTTNPRRPITRPFRTKKTCTAASSSSSKTPMTSTSSLRKTICCFSIALRTAVSRFGDARSSNSRSSDARAICAPAQDDLVGVTFEERQQLGDQLVVRRLLDLSDAGPRTSRCETAGRVCRAARRRNLLSARSDRWCNNRPACR